MSREKTKEKVQGPMRSGMDKNVTVMFLSVAMAAIMTSSAVVVVLMDDDSPMNAAAAETSAGVPISPYTIRDVLIESVITDGKIDKDLLIAKMAGDGDAINLIVGHQYVGMQIPNEVFDPINMNGKTLRLTVKDVDNETVTIWVFDGSKEYNPKSMSSVISLGVSSSFDGSNMEDEEKAEIERYKENNGMSSKSIYLSFDAMGELPYKATVRHMITDEMKITSTFSLYYYDQITKALVGSGAGYNVDEDGFLTMEIDHCSSYILVPEKTQIMSIWTVFALVVILAVAMIEISIVKRWRSE